LLARWAEIKDALPQLHEVSAPLVRDVEAFAALHSGNVKVGGRANDLMDLTRRLESSSKLQDVEAQVRDLAARIQAAGVVMRDFPSDFPDCEDEQSAADVLVLDASEDATCSDERPSSATIQESLRNMQSHLDSVGSEIDGRVDGLLARMAAATQPQSLFQPPPRGRSESGDAAELKAALEVAKRSSWYKEPPPLLTGDIEVIEVRTKIVSRTIHRCPSRPRTSQPVLEANRPEESIRPATAGPSVSAACWTEENSQRPLSAEPRSHLAAGINAVAEDHEQAETAERSPIPPMELSEASDEVDDDMLDPMCSPAVSWHIS